MPGTDAAKCQNIANRQLTLINAQTCKTNAKTTRSKFFSANFVVSLIELTQRGYCKYYNTIFTIVTTQPVKMDKFFRNSKHSIKSHTKKPLPVTCYNGAKITNDLLML